MYLTDFTVGIRIGDIILFITLLRNNSRSIFSFLYDMILCNYNLLTHISLPKLKLQGSYLEGISKGIGGLTQKVKSWYLGRPLVSLECLLNVKNL